MSCRGCAAITFSAVLLSLSLLSFTLIDLDFPNAAPSRFTGYPSWHPVFDHFDQQSYDTSSFFLMISLTLSGYYSLQWVSHWDLPKKFITYFYHENGSRIPAIWFNNSIAYYLSFTSVSGIALFILDTGKLWSTFGVLHNVWEVCILLLLAQGGKITSSLFYAFVAFYVMLVNVLNIVLPWPYDAIWFKAQGLCSDYALFIVFVRIYFATREYVKEQSSAQLPLTNEDDISPANDEPSVSPKVIQHPNQILLLLFASFTHIMGNAAASIFPVDARS
ncbi:16259_t:CDS:2 [Funneliformis geosporum]|uniref:20042_t:CDS:1 n=1 Tax=Funneliformis geosporum TaxID=1117311 RepID=A0A9W4WWK6_9GLOM|nr:20042_t:CDS:2 [Funneliformis geosporum]CAI2188778.1 16259_t:CDS:2 [Funneliformis geosporum]